MLIVDGDVSRIYVIKIFQADSKFVGEECPRHNNSNSGPQVKTSTFKKQIKSANQPLTTTMIMSTI